MSYRRLKGAFRLPAVVTALWLVALGGAATVDYRAYADRLDAESSVSRRIEILRELYSKLPEPSQIRDELDYVLEEGGPDSEAVEAAVGMVRSRAYLEDHQASIGGDPAQEARAITASRAYGDLSTKHDSNWIAKSLDKIRRLIQGQERNTPSRVQRVETGGGVPFLVAAMWAMLAVAAGLFLYLAFRNFSFKRSLKRKAMALLEDDEPQRTADQWLEEAARLESQGRYREAIRCLYLASLLRLDELHVAAFERSQTNWEHYRRFESSPVKPPGIDLLQPTRAFDRFWYGSEPCGPADLEGFRGLYRSLKEAT